MVKNVNFCAAANTSSTYNHNESRSNPSILRTRTIPRKSARKWNIWEDELVLFQVANKIVDIYYPNRIHLHFNLKCNEKTGILAVPECISADKNLHVHLSYHGLYYFRNGFDIKITVPLLNLVCLTWKLCLLSKK